MEWRNRPLVRAELWDGLTLLGVVAETERGDFDAVLVTTGITGKYLGRFEHQATAQKAVWQAVGPDL